jgi:glycosyltransferase involved in cell wall biosynthesis
LRPLRILVIASTYPRYDGDYAVPWLRASVRQLIGRGHKVAVLAPSFEGLADHQIDGVPVHRFRYSPARWEHLTHEEGAPSHIRNHPLCQILGLPYLLMGWRAAVKLARQTRYDIVHVHWPFPHGPMGLAAARACGARLVMTSHGAEYAMAERKPWIRPLLRYSLRRADLLLANSSDTAEHIKMLSGCSATVLPFGTTVQKRFTADDSPTSSPDVGSDSTARLRNGVPRILFTGRLIQRKGVEYLLRAIPRVLACHPAEFIITGDGDQRPRLESLAKSLHLDGAVRFLGFVTNEQLGAEYSSCDVWVNPAIVDDNGDTEGLGVGAIEAYTYRKPVVASAVGGIPDAVRHGVTGLLVREKDEKELADAILTLLDDPKRAAEMAEAGFRFAQETFDWDHLTQRLEWMYYQLLSRKQEPGHAPTRDHPPLLEPLLNAPWWRKYLGRQHPQNS